MPPCRPQKAFRLAAELTYVTGITSAGVDHFGQLLPAVLDLVDVGHVGHRAAGGQVGQDHGDAAAAPGQLFRAVGQDVGRFGHEVDAAKGDRPALVVRRRQRRELVAVAAEVRQGDDFILLIVMAEDQQPRSHLLRTRWIRSSARRF